MASDGAELTFECADNWVSKWVCEPILQGRTYPAIPFVDDVRTVFDVGANCGATSVHLARLYPDATVHAFEPGSEQRAYLERNVASLPNVRVHPIGLHRHDDEVPLYRGDEDSITSSIFRRSVNVDESEQIVLRAAGAWVAEQGIEAIDVMKLDVEGCEVDVLASLAPLLPTVKLLYVEYDSRAARREIDDLLRATHEFYFGMFLALDQGECIYLRNDLADHPDTSDTLRRLLKP